MSTYRSRAYGADEIRAFLHAVDRHLTSRVRVEIIGGSAAALARDPARIRSNFLIMIETVFGELLRASAEKRLKAWGAR